MTDRDRLVELLKDTLHEWECDVSIKTVTEIAEHLISNGVIVLPCKVGDRVYRPSDCLGVVQFVIISFNIYESEMFFTDDSENIIYLSEIGKTVFLTREEAERALREREKEWTEQKK